MSGAGLRGMGRAAWQALRFGRALASRRLGRLVYAAVVFLTLAAIAHILTILLVPRFATRDSGSRFIAMGAEGRAEMLAREGQGGAVVDADPSTVMAACGYDLTDGPLRVSARTGFLPMAISLHMRGGGAFYAVTDKAAQRGLLEFVLLTRQQYEERVARDDDGEGIRELRVVSPARDGIVVARALARQPSDRPQAEALVKAMACGSAD